MGDREADQRATKEEADQKTDTTLATRAVDVVTSVMRKLSLLRSPKRMWCVGFM